MTEYGIYKMGESEPVLWLPSSTPNNFATYNTNAVFSEHHNAIILSNGSDKIIVLPLTKNSPDPYPVEAPLVLSHNVIDIAIDIDGNLVTLSLDDDKYYASTYLLDKDTGKFAVTSTSEVLLEGASISPNVSFTLDRLNGRILLVGEHHAVESFTFGAPINPNTFPHDDTWKNKNNFDALKKDDPSFPIFLQATADTVIYQFPNGTRARAIARTNSIFKVLDYDKHYVLFEDDLSSRFELGYISPRTVTKDGDFEYVLPSKPGAVTDMAFEEARVIFDGTTIYKYPTADRQEFGINDRGLRLTTLEKDFDQKVAGKSGLILRARVVAKDVHGFEFYEILLGFDGTRYFPDDEGDFVGYINKHNVIDFNLAPSQPRFNPNATIRIPSSAPADYRTNGILVYGQNQSTGQFFLIEDLRLSDRQAIRVIGPTIQGRVRISFHDPDIGDDGHTFENIWVYSEYVVMDGLSALQLVAIASLILIVLGGTSFVVVRLRKKRN